MKVLVTGASGDLGGKICQALVSQGHTTINISGGSLDLAYGDISDYNSLLLACSDCDIIYHVAALVEVRLPDPSKFNYVNVGGLKHILRAVAETKTVKKIIYTSSIFALGCTDGGYIASETQVHEEIFFCTEGSFGWVAHCFFYPGLIYGPGRLLLGTMLLERLVISVLCSHFA